MFIWCESINMWYKILNNYYGRDNTRYEIHQHYKHIFQITKLAYFRMQVDNNFVYFSHVSLFNNGIFITHVIFSSIHSQRWKITTISLLVINFALNNTCITEKKKLLVYFKIYRLFNKSPYKILITIHIFIIKMA